jgi:integrase
MKRADSTFLSKRNNGVYYFRILIPKSLQPYLNIKQIKYSLKTRDKAIAISRLGRYSPLINAINQNDLSMSKQLIEDLKRHRKLSDADSLLKEFKTLYKSAADEKSLSPIVFILEKLYGSLAISQAELLRVKLNGSEKEELLNDVLTGFKNLIEFIENEGLSLLLEYIADWDKEFTNDWGVQLYKNLNSISTTSVKQVNSLNQLYTEITESPLSSNEEQTNTFEQPNQNTAFAKKANTDITDTKGDDSLTLSTQWASYLKKRGVELKDNSMMGLVTASKVMLDLLGKKTDIRSLNFEVIEQFNLDVNRLPSGAFTKTLFKGKPLNKVIQIYEAIDDDELYKHELLSSSQIKTYHKHFRGFIEYLNNKFSGQVNPIPCKGMFKLLNEDNRPESETRPFNKEELAKIFNSSIFLDSKAPREQPKAIRFWSILFGAYTGMRLNEICQLRISSIEVENGIYYVNLITDAREGLSLKTKTSKRKVPIHQKIIDAGFPQYYKERLERFEKHPEHTTLFFDIDIRKDRRTLDYSDPTSKAFGRLKTKEIGDTPEVNFHSFRRSFIDSYKDIDSNTTDKQVSRIVGHGKKNQTQRYEGDFELSKLQNTVNMVDYEIESGHIHWDNYKKKKPSFKGYGV